MHAAGGWSLQSTTGRLPAFGRTNRGHLSHLKQEPAIRMIRLDGEQAPVHI